MKTVSFVIPCYRSAKTIGAVTAEIGAAMAALKQYDYEIVLVNDCSPDNTFSMIRALAEQDGRITAIDLAKNFGQHAALMCGMRHSTGDAVVCLDDDGQTPADEVGKLLDKLEALTAKGLNVVVTAHAQMRKFEQPDEMGAYDRWEMKLSKKVAPMLKEWADALLFANYQTLVIEDSKTKSKKAAGGARVMYSTHHPCWDAKNRFGLPDKMDFTYDAIKGIIEGKPAKTKVKDNLQKPKDPEPQMNPIKEGEPEELPFDEPGSAYKELKELMEKAKITDDEVVAACVNKNLQPADLTVEQYPEDFIREFLIAKFDGFSKFIKKNIKDIPFIKHYEEETTKEEKK